MVILILFNFFFLCITTGFKIIKLNKLNNNKKKIFFAFKKLIMLKKKKKEFFFFFPLKIFFFLSFLKEKVKLKLIFKKLYYSKLENSFFF
jgi:hypothetical protein